MSDIILTGLKLNNQSEKNELLKPLNIQSKSELNDTKKIITLNDDTFTKNKTLSNIVILNPVSFFQTNKGNNNNIIIEGNISANNISAVKNMSGNNWLGKLQSNGNREVAVLIPPNSDPNKPYEVVFYFHGHNGKMSEILSSSNTGLKNSILDKAQNKNIIVVVPQGPTKALDYTWMNGKFNESMSDFQADVLKIVKDKLNPFAKIESITVSGHSAGGRPILNASKEGKLIANKINFLDSSYGNWASETYNNIRKQNLNTRFNVVYIAGTQTQQDALSLKNKSGVQMYTSSYSHSLVPQKFFKL
jgi:hypothetical protein